MKSILYVIVGLATLTLAILAQNSEVTAQEPPRPVVKFASAFPVSGQPRQYEIVHQVLEFAPGAATREHRHGGPGFVTVLEGQIARQEGNLVTVHGPGQTYTEPQGVLHSARNIGPGRARVFASFLLSPGSPQTLNDPNLPVPAVLQTTLFLARTMVGTQPAEFEFRQVVNEFAPGAVQPLHTHGGPALAMVIDGEITFEVGGAQLRRTAGGFFEENDPTLVHLARNTGAGPATVVITFLIPPGAPMTTFVAPPSPPAPASPSASFVAVRPPNTGDGGLLPRSLFGPLEALGVLAVVGAAATAAVLGIRLPVSARTKGRLQFVAAREREGSPVSTFPSPAERWTDKPVSSGQNGPTSIC